MSGHILGYVRVSSTNQTAARQSKAVGDVEETVTNRVCCGSCVTHTARAMMLRHV